MVLNSSQTFESTFTQDNNTVKQEKKNKGVTNLPKISEPKPNVMLPRTTNENFFNDENPGRMGLNQLDEFKIGVNTGDSKNTRYNSSAISGNLSELNLGSYIAKRILTR